MLVDVFFMQNSPKVTTTIFDRGSAEYTLSHN